jgi:GAF domain-containing protein
VDYPAAQTSPSRPVSAPVEDDRLVGAFEALHDLSLLRTPAEGMEFVLNLLAEMLPTEASSRCLYDINTDELRFVAVHGVGAGAVQGKAVARTAGLFGQAARNEGRATAFADVMLEPNFNPDVDARPGLDARSMLLRPVVDEHHHMLGMLQLTNRLNMTTFTMEDMNLVNYVAKQLADFLLRVRVRRESNRPPR